MFLGKYAVVGESWRTAYIDTHEDVVELQHC